MDATSKDSRLIINKKRGGKGKSEKSYLRSAKPGMEYLVKRPGSDNWFVRKGSLFKTTGTSVESLARVKREEILSQEKVSYSKKRVPVRLRKTIAEIYEEFRQLKEDTIAFDSYRNHYVYPWRSIEKELSELFIDELTPKHWKFLVAKLRRDRPELSMFSFHKLLNGLLKFSIEAGYLKEDPKIRLDKTQEKEPEINPWTDKEVESILRNCEGEFHMFLKVLAFRGLRPVEARRLRKEFFNKAECGLNLPGFFKIGLVRQKITKTGKSRFVPLGHLNDDLEKWINTVEGDLIFPTMTKAISETTWENLRDALKLEGGLYRFRHYSIVRMLKAGVNPVIVAKIHGHSLNTLYKRYSRFLKEDYNLLLKDL